jgi:hypothetical protein
MLRTIAARLQGVESHLRQIAVSSNIAPNYQRPLSEYPTFDWTSMGAGMISSTRSLQGLIAASAPTSLNVRARRGEGGR